MDNPDGVCDTIWIPNICENRSITFNLNHGMDDDIKEAWDPKGFLWGWNGNCGTWYLIFEVPKTWEVPKKCGMDGSYLPREDIEKFKKILFSKIPPHKFVGEKQIEMIKESIQEVKQEG